MCCRCKQVEDTVFWIFIDYLCKKKFLQAISYWFWIKPITYYDSFLHFGKWQNKSQILDKPDLQICLLHKHVNKT